MNKASMGSVGSRYGLIGGLIYIILLMLLYTYRPLNPLSFSFYKVLIYLLVVFFLVLCAKEQRKLQGGYAEVRDLMRPMLIAIVTIELLYATFNYIYLNFIEPQFFDIIISNTRQWLESKGIPEEQIDAQMEQVQVNTSNPNLANTLAGVGVWILLDSLIAFIIAAAIKKEKPPFEEIN